LKTRLAILVACLVVCLAGGASTASAAVSIPTFGESLSGEQAGSNPDFALAAAFSTSSGDALKDALISLPPGLLVNPTAATVCPDASFQAGDCPSSSQIGDGTVTATEVVVGGVQFPVGLFLISPQGSDFARIGMIATLSGAPVISVSAPVTFRGGANPGLDILLAGIPNQIAGLPAHIDTLSLRLFGTVNGNAFTRLPTSCGPAQTFFAIDSYQVAPTAATAAQSFAPVGCSSLSYQPQLTLGASIDPSDNGVGLRAALTQAPNEAASSSIALLLPSGIAPNGSALSSGCAASDVSTCPAIGTATASTPLLPSPVVGKLVLASGSTLYAVFPPPLGLTLPGTASISGNALQLTFSGMPDVPFTSLEFDVNGGPGSILTVGSGLCSGPQTVGGQMVGQSGATIPVNAGLGVGGCRSFGSAASRPSASRVSLSGFASGHPKLHFLASNVTTTSIGLPRGLSFSLRKRGGLSLSGARLKQMKISQGRLLITLRSSAARVGVTITAPLLRESAGFQRKVKGHQIKNSVVGLKLSGNAGQTSLPVKLKVT
jgi:hypothetical protein